MPRQDILVADANGEHPLNLTHSPEFESHPAWSPDGAYLLYIKSFTVENTSHSEIWVSRPDGTDQRKVADGMLASWSPDGQQILYAAADSPTGKNIIAIAYRAGGDPVWGKTLQNSVRDLAWSPDGSKFVFSTVDGLFSMDRNGTNPNPAHSRPDPNYQYRLVTGQPTDRFFGQRLPPDSAELIHDPGGWQRPGEFDQLQFGRTIRIFLVARWQLVGV